MKQMIQASVLSLILINTMWLVGCNTVAGFGKDVSKSGEAITDVAKKK